MADVIISSQSIDSKTLTVTSADSSYPKTNMQDRRLSTYWKSTSSADQNIDIDMGSAIEINHAVLYHNLPSLTYIDIYYATVSDYSDQISVTDDNPLVTTEVGPQVFYFPFPSGNSYTKRYWRIKLTHLSSVAMVHLLFIGLSKSITQRFMKSSIIGNDYSGNQLQESYGGKRFSIEYIGARKKLVLAWELLDSTNHGKLVTLMSDCHGSHYPFWIKDLDGNWTYVRLKSPNLNNPEIEVNLYNVGPLTFEEEL